MNRLSTLALVFIVAGCSTVERRGYYEPSVEPTHRSGPEKQGCGFANFGGPPDRYVSTIESHTVSVTANQYLHPYLWGPWFVSVVPVFPITWLVDLVSDDSLEMTVYVEPAASVEREDVFISYASSKAESVYPSSLKMYGTATHLVFPADADDLQAFNFHMKLFGEHVTIPFVKATRWAWTQWTPNC